MDLKNSFPSLSYFSDIDWDKVGAEYKISSQIMTFPEYLEMKAEEGDCPPHLFELAYFEEALMTLQSSEFLFPEDPGIFLNPAACFLTLDFDVVEMMARAQDGKIEIIERPHVLSIFVDPDGEIQFMDLSNEEIDILSSLENGDRISEEKAPLIEKLYHAGLVLINE